MSQPRVDLERTARGRQRGAIVAVWLLAAGGAGVVVAVVPGADAFAWLAVVLSLSVVAGFVGQLVVGEQAGFVERLAAACTGAFVLVALGGLVALLRVVAR